MSFYNMLFGRNPFSEIIVGMLGFTSADFGRFRDCFLKEDRIAVYTRCGGGNRDDYQDVFEKMRSHPNFVSDEDDDFDSTYCTFYFSFPEKYKDTLSKLDKTDFSGDKRWSDLFERMKQPDYDPKKEHPEMTKKMEEIFSDMKTAESGKVYKV